MSAMTESKKSEYWSGNDQDFERIRAWLQAEADAGRIRVYRVSNRSYSQDLVHHYHVVEFYNEKGEIVEDSTGYVTDLDCALGKWHEKYVKWSEKVDDEHTKIRMMLSDSLPSFPVFEGANLGFNDDDHFYHFEIVMHNSAIDDDFE